MCCYAYVHYDDYSKTLASTRLNVDQSKPMLHFAAINSDYLTCDRDEETLDRVERGTVVGQNYISLRAYMLSWCVLYIIKY